jgi:hypothetical protein
MIQRLKERLTLLARDSESGAAMVEFVVVFPVQLTLTLLLIQFAFLAHAHMVVQHAAFVGARDAAVYDGMTGMTLSGLEADPISANDAALRAAARTVSVLAAGVTPTAAGGRSLTTKPNIAPMKSDFRWGSSEGGRQVPDIKQQEAYSLINLELEETHNAVGLTVEYDYVMIIPVANKMLADIQGLPTNERVQLPGGMHAFRVRRKAYVPTPWRAHPTQAQGAAVSVAVDDGVPVDPENQ